MALGLIVLGWMTWGLGGISFGRPPVTWPDWLGLTQLGFGALAVALAQESWRRDRLGRGPSREIPASAPAVPAAVATPTAPATRAVQADAVRRPRGMAAIVAGWRRLWRPSRVQVRLGGVAEHRCPYCLDPISRRDPRGVVECPICHTPHHADCWAVTGMCQVPHHR
jgi:Prokaryotic RING finger family 1